MPPTAPPFSNGFPLKSHSGSKRASTWRGVSVGAVQLDA